MRVDWAALGLVTVVSIVTSVIFTVLLATGIRLISAAKIKSNEGGSGTATVSLGYVLIGIAGLLVLFGIYLIVPQLPLEDLLLILADVSCVNQRPFLRC